MSSSLKPGIRVITDKSIAYDSPDHLYPHGTAHDNSVAPRFNEKLFRCIPAAECQLLDIGCAGGGFVKSILDAGGFAVGIEGSDYSQRRQRAEWATIPDYLFTADATAPFQVMQHGEEPVRFNVITGWEFLEHIQKPDLSMLFENIARHLAPGGMAIFSVADLPHKPDGVALHQTVQSEHWWLKTVREFGFLPHDNMVAYFGEDWVRNEPCSFHLVLTRKGEDLPCSLALQSVTAFDTKQIRRRRIARRMQPIATRMLSAFAPITKAVFLIGCRLTPRALKEAVKALRRH